MAIEKKTGLFYELMIRGNWDPQAKDSNGTLIPLGAVTTYQFTTGTALVDTDTNTLVANFAPDPAVDLTKEQAVEFLDGKFSDFIGQLADAQKQLADTVEASKSATKDAAKAIADRDAAISDRDNLIASLNEAHGVMSAHFVAAAKAAQPIIPAVPTAPAAPIG